MTSIEGTVLNIIFRNDENGYTVLEADVSGEISTCVGTMQTLMPGEYAVFYGAWTTHKSFGRQFKTNAVKSSLPKSLESIELYLSSGLITGIGEVLASRIVEKFGYETFDVLLSTPELLSEIKGVSKKAAQRMSEQFREQSATQSIVMDLQNLGLTVKQALHAYETYGAAAAELISNNPYRLIEEIHGFGFERADRIAQFMGMSLDSDYRIENGVKHVLKLALRSGNTCLPQTMLLRRASEMLQVPEEKISEKLAGLTMRGDIVRIDYGYRTAVFLKSAYLCEHDCAVLLLSILNTKPLVNIKNPTLDYYTGDCALSEEQERAVLCALDSNAMVITGGPGTGKTTIINAILQIYERLGLTVALCAPTGRAAKRMEQSTGREAKTIHRLLEYGMATPEEDDDYTALPDFARNEDNPINAEAVIVDEMSMVDIFLFRSLLKAMAPGCRLIMVGDADQLPSVGPGNVLRDVIESKTLPVATLSHFYRQQGGGTIVENAHRVNSGEYPSLHPAGDFVFVPIQSADDVLEELKRCVKRLSADHDIYSKLQILCPMKKGSLGVFNLNREIREVLNPNEYNSAEININGCVFRVGDKIMQTRNNYCIEWVNINNYALKGTGVFNGDMGKITEIDLKDEEVKILFENERLCVYDAKLLEQIEHAYATTVHKAQGSEFDIVILPMCYGASLFLTRNLLYTALTRAKKKVLILGQEHTIFHMVDNNKISARYTVLRREILDVMELCHG